MAYSDLPIATDHINISQAGIRENFSQISSLIAKDHITFAGVPASVGKHNKTTLIEQAVAPVTAGNEMALYTKEIGLVSALFLRNENAGAEVDLTTAQKGSSGACTLPSGILMKWGTGSIADGSYSSGNITFSAAFAGAADFPTAAFFCQITSKEGIIGDFGRYVFSVENLNRVNFSVQRNTHQTGHVAPFYYFAMGY